MKVAIVTGASGNMGQAVVKKFISEGYYVVGTIVPHDTIPMDFPGDKFEKIVVDLMNEDDSHKFVSSIVEKHGRIDAAILTVGGFAMGKIAETKTADIVNQHKLNFETAYNVAQPVFVQMLKQNSGRIFIIGSKPGLSAKDGKGMVAYGLAKSLIIRLAELMNGEAKGTNAFTGQHQDRTVSGAGRHKLTALQVDEDQLGGDEHADAREFRVEELVEPLQ